MRTVEKNMTIQEVEALNLLKTGNYEAWKIFVGYFQRRFEYEKNKLVISQPEHIQIQQGIAKAFGEMSEIETHAEEVYEACKGE